MTMGSTPRPYTEGGDYGVVVLPARPGGSLPLVREARWRRALAPEPARREQAVDHRLEHPQVGEQPSRDPHLMRPTSSARSRPRRQTAAPPPRATPAPPGCAPPAPPAAGRWTLLLMGTGSARRRTRPRRGIRSRRRTRPRRGTRSRRRTRPRTATRSPPRRPRRPHLAPAAPAAPAAPGTPPGSAVGAPRP